MTDATTRSDDVAEILGEIRERCDEATPGPWRVVLNDMNETAGGALATECTSDEHSVEEDPGREFMEQCCYGTALFGDFGFHEVGDADFVAAAREDVPRLLDALDGVLGEVVKAEEFVATMPEIPESRAVLAAARGMSEAIREAITEALTRNNEED